MVVVAAMSASLCVYSVDSVVLNLLSAGFAFVVVNTRCHYQEEHVILILMLMIWMIPRCSSVWSRDPGSCAGLGPGDVVGMVTHHKFPGCSVPFQQ